MTTPAFITRGDLTWTRHGRGYEARRGDVTLTAETRWYSSAWTVRATSALALPIDVTLFVGRRHGSHGYWSNVHVDLRTRWSKHYFAYCSVSPLASMLLGEATLRAIASHDAHLENPDDPIADPPHVELHVRGGLVETTTVVPGDIDSVVDDQLAIHAALGADHAALLESWRVAAVALGGELVRAWPPVITVPAPFGTTTIELQWPSTEQRGAHASIALTVDARHAPLWNLEPGIPNGTVIGGRVFLVTGQPPIDVQELARAVTEAGLVSIHVRRDIHVRIARSRPDAEELAIVLDAIAKLVPPSAPYR